VSNVSPLTHLVMIGWIPVVQVLFMMLPPRRAVIASYVGAWLFLPVVLYPVPMLPDVSKMLATSAGVLLAVVLFDPGRFGTLRPRLLDLPMGAWCIAPFFASVTNGLGVYDGLTAILDQTIMWGLPYLIGRMYFTDLAALRELGVGLVIGGLVYLPLVALESAISPQLHRMVYGYHAHSFQQTKRMGGWRPTVFMQHGLMVAMWMASTALVALWLWWTRAVKSIWGVPMLWIVIALGVGVVLVKSVGAWLAFAAGVGCLVAIKYLKTPALVYAILVAVPGYMAARTIIGWDGSQLVQAAHAVAGEERASSLKTRLDNEDLLKAKAMRQPLFGWGRWGRNRVYDENGNDISTTDGLWVIALGQTGVFGAAALTTVFMVPMLSVRAGIRKRWHDARSAPAVVMALLCALYLMDNLLNAMVNPMFTLIAGGLIGLRGAPRAATSVEAAPVAEDDGGAAAPRAERERAA